MMDENERLQAEVANLNGQVSTLIDWVMGDVDALTALQDIYVNADDPATRIKAAAAAIGYERPKLAATANLGRGGFPGTCAASAAEGDG